MTIFALRKKDDDAMPEQSDKSISPLDLIHQRRAADVTRRAALFRNVARKMAAAEQLRESEITDLTAALDAGHIDERKLREAAAAYRKFDDLVVRAADKVRIANVAKAKAAKVRERIPTIRKELAELEAIAHGADKLSQSAASMIACVNTEVSARPDLFPDVDARAMVERLAKEPDAAA